MKKILAACFFLSIVTCFSPILSFAQSSFIQSSYIEASANSEVKVAATKVAISLQVVRNASKAKEALNKNSEISDKVIAFLKNNSNVSDLVTDTVQVYETKRYDNIKNESVTTGYESRNQISFSVTLKEAGNTIDETIALGANNLMSVSPIAEDSALENAKLEAIAQATQKAKATAEKSLQAVGLTAKGIKFISVDPSNHFIPSPRPMDMVAFKRGDMMEAASTPIEGGFNTVRASVLVRIEF